MTNGTSAPGNKHCTHDWKIVDTRTDPMYGPEKNPVFNLKCRTCGAETQVQGHRALKSLSNRTPLNPGLG